MFKRVMVSALVFGTLAAAPPAVAQSERSCAPRDTVISQLAGKFSEVRKGAGLANPNALIEVWTSEKTGSWTIIVTQPNGTSCIVAAGNTWIDDEEKIEARGDPV